MASSCPNCGAAINPLELIGRCSTCGAPPVMAVGPVPGRDEIPDLVAKLRAPEPEVRAQASASLRRYACAEAASFAPGRLASGLKAVAMFAVGMLALLVVLAGVLARVLKFIGS